MTFAAASDQKPRPTRATPRRVPDITKIQKLIDYKPTLDIAEIIDTIIAHHRATGST